MDLQSIVRRRPRHTSAEQLGHASLKIAAALFIFLAGREVGQLARDHRFDRHHRQFRRNAREGDQRLAELLAVLGVLHRHVDRRTGHTHGAGRGLDAGAFERLHQLFEALAFDAAQKVLALHGKAVEIDRVFLHPAIAEHLDFAARDARVLPGRFIGAGRLFGQEHRQALVIVGVRHRAGQNGHHMGARGMGDPRLVAGDRPIVAVLHRLGAQSAKVRAGVRLGKDGRGQDLTRSEAGQPFLFLSLGAAAEDQLGRDFGPRAQ